MRKGLGKKNDHYFVHIFFVHCKPTFIHDGINLRFSGHQPVRDDKF